jgi:hypothetical protein
MRYDLVPWLTPEYRREADASGFGEVAFDGLGLEWCGLRVGFPASLEVARPAVPSSGWWRHLREVPASPVAVRGESEGFLFYDGSASIPPPVRVSRPGEAPDDLSVEALPFDRYPDSPTASQVNASWWLTDAEKQRIRMTLPIPAVLVVRVGEGGALAGTVLTDLEPRDGPARVSLSGLRIEGEALVARFRGILEAQGLAGPEAESLVQTWRTEFFATPGIRVLTVLPRWMYDAVLPMTVLPYPGEIARVGIVWKECEGLDVPAAAVPSSHAAEGTAEDAAQDARQGAGQGTAARAREERFPEAPYEVQEGRSPLATSEWKPGPSAPLEIREDGEIVAGPGEVRGSRVSADGSRLAVALLSGSSYRVRLADLRERTVLDVAAAGEVKMKYPGALCLSADGRKLAWSLDLVGGREARWVDLAAGRIVDLGGRIPLDISADGRRVICAETGARGIPGGGGVRLLDLEDGREWAIPSPPEAGRSTHDWSLCADGAIVACAGPASDAGEVYRIDVEARTIVNVSAASGRDDKPSLSRDGMRVLFESQRDRDSEIYLADLEAGTVVNLTGRPGDDRFPWLRPDGKVALYRDWDAGFCLLHIESGKKRVIPGTTHVWTMSISDDLRTAVLVRFRDKVPYLCVHSLEDPGF